MNKKLFFLSMIILVSNKHSLAMEELTTWFNQNSVYIAMAQSALITGLVGFCAWSYYSHQRQINQVNNTFGDVRSACAQSLNEQMKPVIQDTVESLLVALTNDKIAERVEEQTERYFEKKIIDLNIAGIRTDIAKITFNVIRLAKFIFSPFVGEELPEENDNINFMPYYSPKWDTEDILTLLQKHTAVKIKKSNSKELFDRKKISDSDKEISEIFDDYVELEISPRNPPSRSTSPDKVSKNPLAMVSSPRKDKGKSIEPSSMLRKSISSSSIQVPTKFKIPKLNLRKPIPPSSDANLPSSSSSTSSSDSSPSSSPEG